MAQDVPTPLFLEQIGNTTVRAVLNSTATLPTSISPSTFLFSIVEGLDKAQAIFNSENGSVPNVATVSAREVGPITPTADGKIQTQVFYTVGGNIVFDVGNAEPIIL
ncbi:MAG: hypothetical protein JGK38_23920 [Microcoleus sp. PH2017_15_JOR_U_A]|uniref:hypothetical protein n=1 Tax=unclassified Microcoleus TaxID=2642155 RepID=UPI001DE60CBB|nr:MULTISPECIES: hypothetical protein [unclassified Microcoleus]MCC3473307.1 hypothetical protein [Microcoleus sp. PH2017_13_LAR_U_A]MCC3486527.1 hypothetical protein [Microcoleus sp. PH2017_14_LAR_D_A]MCC3499605.1 hypothetical protein [Microcoleus sp. PH2017_15_JOR_U_A]MCC3600176.1 hypothetical protein [Microcoleus sp. PH2017_26_ELK_O_A]MCC3623169.1 hypothetical protein [Microcoleus sp. PH2017_36_ELK_O_B]